MRIIHLSTSLLNGGMENMMVDIANEQFKLGHQVAILIINKRLEDSIVHRIDGGVQTFFIGRSTGSKSIVPVLSFLRLYFKIYAFDVFHAHSLYLGKYMKYFAKKKIVLTIHGLNYETLPLKHYDKLYAISEAVRRDIIERSFYNPTVVYNGIRTETIRVKSLTAKNSVYKIVMVSRLEHQNKGQDILLEALARIVKENRTAKFSLDLIGDGKSRSYLEDLTVTLNLSNVVRFLGNKSREWVYKHLSTYDLFIQASRYEGFGLTVAEAMAAKVPVIVANNDGPAEVIANGQYGFIFENGNAEDLAKKIRLVMEMSKSSMLDKTIDEAYKYCLNTFDIKQTASRYIEEYSKLLK